MWTLWALLAGMNLAAHGIKRQVPGRWVLPGEEDFIYRAFYNGVVTGHYLFGITALLVTVLFGGRWIWRLSFGRSQAALPDRANAVTIGRRDLLKNAAGGGFVLAGIGTLASSRVRPDEIIIERWKVPVPLHLAAASGFRIVQVTDPHVGPMFDSVAWRHTLQMAVKERPDLIALTGDFIDRVNDRWLEPFIAPLSELPYEIPAIAITGNHDHYWGADRLQRAVEERTAVRFLRNSADEQFLQKHGIEIVGIDDPVSQNPKLPASAGGMKDDQWLWGDRTRYRILLAHRPWVVRGGMVQRAFDLTLAGHTHGGMISPNIPFLPEFRLLRPFYDRGWFPPDRRLNEQGWLFVSRGVGYAGPRWRFNCPPEISVLELSAVVREPEKIS